MPMVPVVRARRRFDDAVQMAYVRSEHGYKHSSMVHSLNVDHMTQMARAVDTTALRQERLQRRRPRLSAAKATSATPSPRPPGKASPPPCTFTRKRRCVMVDNLRIY
jgi:aldehyde dehydrogenase